MWCVWHTEAAQTWPFGASAGVCWPDRHCPNPAKPCSGHATGSRARLLPAAGTGRRAAAKAVGSRDSAAFSGCCMRKGWVASAMQPNNNMAGNEEEENCGSTQQIKYAKYLHLVERKWSSRVCYLHNFSKQAIELHSDFRPEIWIFSNWNKWVFANYFKGNV